MPPQIGAPWLSIVPIAASRSSYDGLLVFVFIALSGTLAAFAIHRLASDRLRRAPAWDCGYPDSSPATQYTADELRPADPPRVRHRCVPRPRAGRHAAARRHAAGAARRSECTIRSGTALYAPLVVGIGARRRPAQSSAVPDHPAVPQPGVLRAGHSAPGARDMVLIRDLTIQGAQMLLVLLLAPLLTGFVRKVKARLLRRQGPPLIQPYRDLVPPDAQGGGAGGERVLAVPRHPLSDLRRHLGRRGAGADLRAPGCCSPGRPISSPSSRCSAARASSWRSPAWTSAPASAASARAAR